MKMKTKAVFTVSAFLLWSISTIAYATFESTSTSFKSTDQNVSETGGNTTSTDFRLYQNVGQTSVGESTSTNFKIRAGVLYWTVPTPAPAPTPTPTPTPTPSPGGGGAPPPPTKIPPGLLPPPTCDFNNDGLCNIVDLSILLFWYGKTGPEIVRYDLNIDGRIDLKDISILFYHWKE